MALTPDCLKKGAVVYVQVCGKFVPRRPWDLRPQPFELTDDWPSNKIGLKPLDKVPQGVDPIVIDARGGMI